MALARAAATADSRALTGSTNSPCRLLNVCPAWTQRAASAGALGVRAFSALISPPSKAVVYEQQGSPDAVTRVVEVPPVMVKENDLCVGMLAAHINPSDINSIEGVYPVRPPVPAIGGREGVGEVHMVDSEVKDFSPRDLIILSPPSFGDSIVRNGAASMVGRCVIQITEFRGIKTVNLMREGLVQMKRERAVERSGC